MSLGQRSTFLFLLSMFMISCSSAQVHHPARKYHVPEVDPLENFEMKVYPPSWWSGMERDTIELIIHAPGIQNAELHQHNEGIELLKVDKVENPNYLFATIHIKEDLEPGAYDFMMVQGGDMAFAVPFEILGNKNHQADPLNASDILYLIMPDRFANGDPDNDGLNKYHESDINRKQILARHGGDLQGVMDHLDYLKDLGVSALWLNPVQENNQFYESYHGYAITDHYRIDDRLGSNELYVDWVDSCHQHGMKVIMDVVLNHCGDQHWFIRDLPEMDWVHVFEEFTRANFRATTQMDPYAAPSERMEFVQGWFDLHMPDLNQKNPRVRNFLIQNSIWWVEYAGLDGYRIDTYPYSYIDFSNEWIEALRKEYPSLTLFGETWVHNIPIQAFFSEKEHLFKQGSKSPALTDFQMHYALLRAITQKAGWTEGVSAIYYVLAQDFMYEHPEDHVIFLDNHDLSRIWTVVDKDLHKYKLGLTLLLTTRGIPMLYYGTEVLLEGEGGAFGEYGRVDFPGGWPDDKVSKFDKEGRTEMEQEAYHFLQRLIELRKKHLVLSKGELMQFIPNNGVYTFARYDESETFLVCVNGSGEKRIFEGGRYSDAIGNRRTAFDHISQREISLDRYRMEAGEFLLLEIK